MIIAKECIGKHEMIDGSVYYYIIKKSNLYGIEIVQEQASEVISTSQWVSENKDSAMALGQLLCLQGASPVHLDEIIDDYIE